MTRISKATLTLIVALFVVLLGTHGHADNQGKLPKEAVLVITRLNNEILAAKKKAAAALNDLLEETIRKADLDGANAIKAAIEDLQIPRGGAAALALVGSWQVQNSTIEFTADGKAFNRTNNDEGLWRENRNMIEVRWENGWRHVVSPQGAGFAGQFLGPKGEAGPLSYSRKSAP